MSVSQSLASGIAQAGWPVSSEIQAKLVAYLQLLHKWNKVHNLTAVRDMDDMVTLHLLDSLSVLNHVQRLAPARLLDVGSGAGLPGIVLALCMPDLHVTTIDAVQKKASFMRQAKGELSIDNLNVVSGRVEQYRPDHTFDIVISRAFSELALFIKLTQHLLSPSGHWLAMKGVVPENEMQKLTVQPSAIEPLHVPGLDAQRHLVIVPAISHTSSILSKTA